MPKHGSRKRQHSSSSTDSDFARRRQRKHKERKRAPSADSRGNNRKKASSSEETSNAKVQTHRKVTNKELAADTANSVPKDSATGANGEQVGKLDKKSGGSSCGLGLRHAGLGDLAELQKQLDKERSSLQLFIIKAKQEHDDKQETNERRERREREYFKASFGEPCGPGNRFLLEDEIGKGAFSTVFRCRDTGAQGKEYAIKFIRSNAMLRKATEKEVKLMRRLRNQASEKDPEGARCFLALAGPETFEHNGHFALVFQLQRCDLRSGLQKYGQGRGLPLATVQNYAKNIFLALRALRRINIIHSDLKPDNLLISLDKSSVKLSDFGSAMDVAERVRTDYVQPRYYRSPEIILGQSYGTQIDIWSAGATLFELATGRILFTGKTNNGMLHEMLKICGAFKKQFATSGEFAARHFNDDGDLMIDRQSTNKSELVVPMAQFLKPSQTILHVMQEAIKEPTDGIASKLHLAVLQHLASLITKCIIPSPTERATPELALEHRLFHRGA